MNDRINHNNKLRVIFSLSSHHIATLNELAMKSNRSRSGVIAILIEHSKNHPEISRILGGGL